jgi:hypothetical protein
MMMLARTESKKKKWPSSLAIIKRCNWKLKRIKPKWKAKSGAQSVLSPVCRQCRLRLDRAADERALAWEAEIARLHQRTEQPQPRQAFDFSAYTAEKAAMNATNKKLEEEVVVLRDEVERLMSELEISKATLARREA